jgi:hypothetical protein
VKSAIGGLLALALGTLQSQVPAKSSVMSVMTGMGRTGRLGGMIVACMVSSLWISVRLSGRVILRH